MLAFINFSWSELLLTNARERALIGWLKSCAPDWCAAVSVFGREDKKIPINIGHPRWLSEAADLSMTDYMRTERARLFGNQANAPAAEGSYELNGANGQLIIIVDSALKGIWRRVDGLIQFHNCVSVQILAPRVEGRPLADWAYDCFVAGCRDVHPEYAFAVMDDEYEALNMDRSDGVAAIGRDYSKYLPGIYWLNYFGTHLTGVLDRQKLLSAPATKVEALGNGVLLVQRERPDDWNLPEVVTRRRDIRKHIGAGYFFDREDAETPPAGLGYDARP